MSGSGPEGFYNDGLLQLGPDAGGGPQTIVVTGMARSGTSMMARLLVAAGVDMGSARDDVVFEDHEISFALTGHGSPLGKVVAERNRRAAVWGFKRPHLFAHAGPEIAAALRNPRFIITSRDVVAIAKRNCIAELFDPGAALRWAAADVGLCIDFALGLNAPVLLTSYEKALQQPERLIDRVLGFCGLAVSSRVRSDMLDSVEADRAEYVQSARRAYDGYVDGVKDNVVFGWCRQIGLDAPLDIEVRVDGHPPLQGRANVVRPDLAAAGVSFLRHGFRQDLSQFVRTGQERVTVRVLHRQFELHGSGRTVAELAGLT